MAANFFAFALVLSAAEWYACWKDLSSIRWFTKLGAMAAIIAWFTLAGLWRGALVWFGLALVFSWLGDALLLNKKLFLAGLGAFLIAQVLYITGFNLSPLVFQWSGLALIALVAGAFILLNGRIQAGIKAKGDMKMALPVMAYAAVLSLMCLSALSTLLRPAWPLVAAICASLGGCLFFFSDAMLAYNRFVKSLRLGHLLVMVSYLIAQVLLAAGALLAYAHLF